MHKVAIIENIHRDGIELLNKNPKSAYLYNYLGVCLAQQKKFAEALKCLEESIKIDPKADDTLFNKSIVKLRLGDFKEGWDLYSHGLTKENNIREGNRIIVLQSSKNL